MPCELTATFEMVNSSGTSKDMRMGFPMPAGEFESRPTTVPDDLTITFDGVPADVTPPGGGTEDRDNRRDWVWYHCQHTFKPGTTTVVVKAPLRASLDSGRAFHESLYYCIETGGKWGGAIGEEVVTIRFPHPIAKEQIARASPAGYEIEGNSVRWRFVNFKPTGQTHDIAITYLRPDAMRVLSALRQDVARAPDSTAAAVKLAKHLLVLGYAKSNAGFLPRRLTREEFDAINQNIAAQKDRRTFIAFYRLNAEGQYELADTDWTKRASVSRANPGRCRLPGSILPISPAYSKPNDC